jgi:hypothetical protein
MKRLVLFLFLLGWIFVGNVFSQSLPRIDYRWPDSLKGFQENVWCLLVKDGIIFAGTSDMYLFVSTDTGKTWIQRGPKSGLTIDLGLVWGLAVTPSGKLLLAGFSGMYSSTDNGVSWKEIPMFHGHYVYNFLVSRSGKIFSTSSYGICVSSDDGNTWHQVGDTLARSALCLAQTPSGTILAGDLRPFEMNSSSGILRSTDDGNTWTLSNNGLTGTSKNIESIAAYPSGFSQEVFLATYMDGAYYSNNDGLSWSHINDIPLILGRAVGVFPPLGVFIGFQATTHDPLYRLVGSSWQTIPGLRGYIVLSLAQFSPNQILVGTHDGVFLLTWENPLKVADKGIPTAYQLFQNYPNPFNPTTTIEFSLPERSFVKLTVYNALGQEVAVLVDEEKSPGKYTVTFDGSKLPSGVYFCRLHTGGFDDTREMVLVK